MRVYEFKIGDKEELLSWEDIQEEEGIYEYAGDRDDTFIVLDSDEGPVVLYHSKKERFVFVADPGDWRSGKFVKTNKKLYMKVEE